MAQVILSPLVGPVGWVFIQDREAITDNLFVCFELIPSDFALVQ